MFDSNHLVGSSAFNEISSPDRPFSSTLSDPTVSLPIVVFL